MPSNVCAKVAILPLGFAPPGQDHAYHIEDVKICGPYLLVTEEGMWPIKGRQQQRYYLTGDVDVTVSGAILVCLVYVVVVFGQADTVSIGDVDILLWHLW